MLDLTRLTERQARALTALASRVCGRVRVDEDGQTLFRPEPKSRPALALFAAVAAAACGGADAPPPMVATSVPQLAHSEPKSNRDGDGLPDDEDACPDLAGSRDDHGRGPQGAAMKGAPAPPVVISATLGILCLEHVQFGRLRTDLDPPSKAVLDNMVLVLNESPEIELVIVTGHADGTERNADALGLQRAKAAIAYLVRKGIAPQRLTPASAGSRDPRDPDDTTEARATNRRVEFRMSEAPP